MGGGIEAESRKGRGSNFSFSIWVETEEEEILQDQPVYLQVIHDENLRHIPDTVIHISIYLGFRSPGGCGEGPWPGRSGLYHKAFCAEDRPGEGRGSSEPVSGEPYVRMLLNRFALFVIQSRLFSKQFPGNPDIPDITQRRSQFYRIDIST